MIGSSDSDSDEDKRVVRSAKDRRFDELKATCEELRVRLTMPSCLTCSAREPFSECISWQGTYRCADLHPSLRGLPPSTEHKFMSGFALFNRVARIRAVGTVLLLVLDYVIKALLMLVYLVSVQNKLNINDWSAVQSLFDKLNKQMEKTQKAADSVGTPRVYIKMLVELEVTTHCISEQHMNTFWAKACTAAQEARAAGLLVKLSWRKGAFVGPVVIHFFC